MIMMKMKMINNGDEDDEDDDDNNRPNHDDDDDDFHCLITKAKCAFKYNLQQLYPLSIIFEFFRKFQ